MFQFQQNSASNRIDIFLQDSSSSTGDGLSGLAHDTSGLKCYYHKPDGTASVQISLVTMTLGTFTSGGFKEIDATNMKGHYQFCVPDALLTVLGGGSLHFYGATNLMRTVIPFQVTPATVTVGTNNDKTGYSLSQSFPSNFASLAITAAGKVTVGTNDDKTGYALTSGQEDAIVTKVWNALTTSFSTADSIGKKLKDWALGTDNKSLISSDSHTSGVTITAVSGAVGSVTGNLGGNVTGSVGSVADPSSIWAALTSNMSTAGSIGKKLKDWALGTDNKALISADVHSAGVTVAAVSGAVASVTGNVGGNVSGSVGSVSDPASIWNALTSSFSTAGSIGKKLKDWSLGSDNRVLISADSHTGGVTVAAVTGAVGSVTGGVGGSVSGSVGSVSNPQSIWDALLASQSTAGSIGKKIKDWVLGSDNKAVLSADVHSSGATVAASVITGSVADPVTVGTVNDKTGYSLSSAGLAAVATEVLTTDIDTIEDLIADAKCLGRVPMMMMNRKTLSSTTLSVYFGDNSTVAWTQSVTTNEALLPISGTGEAT